MAKKKSTSLEVSNAIRSDLPLGVKYVRTLQGHTDIVWRIAWSPNGKILASPSSDRTIRVWDAKSGEVLHTLERHGKEVTCVAFDREGHLLASGSQDKTIKIWEVSTGRLLRTLKGHTESIFGVVFGPQAQIASCGMDGKIMLWDTLSGRTLKVIKQQSDGLIDIAFDPKDGTFAWGGNGGRVTIWHAETGKTKSFKATSEGFVAGIAFSPGGGKLASAGSDGNITLWEVATGRPALTIEGHTDGISSVGFSADGRVIAAKGWDGIITVSRCDTGAMLVKIPDPIGGALRILSGLAFHPELLMLATVSSVPNTLNHKNHKNIDIYELDLNFLFAQAITPSITYTSAKIVLVGESNVGKSYLAHRIANGTPPEAGAIKSTHGMKFWPLEPERLCPTAMPPATQRRDVVIWDMGGQEEYRLIHQLFLHDTTVALVLFNPIRGVTSFKDVETWTNYLDKQLSGRAAVKLLVGAQIDETCNTIDQEAVKRLCVDHGFAGYFETSAISGRGIPELCEATAQAINWDDLSQTSRPALFQLIRDVIETKRKMGEIVLYVADLLRVLGDGFSTEDETKAVNAVTEQLATQGVIARSRVSTGEPVLVLQVQEIERYAGSLILAARKNPRGVPALELRAIAQPTLMPGIAEEYRLPRSQEKPVIECTVQLMLEHGICFEHEGLLVFPTLFAPGPSSTSTELLHAVSLYYDFAGAIDNIYASLVAWLVLAQDFGRVRLWPDRAEFEVKDAGICGLRKVGRPGGFAHVDVYFEANTPEHLRKEFINFVEDHLTRHGVEIQEHLAVTCSCGHQFEEETLRQRIVRGDKDVGCPVCESRHKLTEGAAEARERDPKIEQRTWALRTKIEKLREKSTEQAVQVINTATKIEPVPRPIRVLHLSDLHFDATTTVEARLQWLLDDLKQDGGIDFKELDYLVITGDFTDKACAEGFEKAYDFVSGLAKEFNLSAERCIFVPGNHDVTDLVDAYTRRKDSAGLNDDEWMQEGRIVVARDPQKYPLRFKPFSDGFFHKFLQRPYPADYVEQGMAIPFWESGIQFLALNSSWQIDEFYRKRSGVNVGAVARAINTAQKQEAEARESGLLSPDQPLLRIALFHHAVAGPEQIKDVDFLGNLQKNGVKLILHGDVHKMQRDQVGYRHEKKMHVVGAGSFGARAMDRPEGSPRVYNAIEINRELSVARVHTRQQSKPDGPWDGWYEWADPNGGEGRVPYYDIQF